MRLALRNLLSNALRYSPATSPVRVTISDSDDPLALVIEVADTGPGLAADALAHLFERHRARSAETTGPHGMGLGLYIVRRVMELHGGQVELVRNGAFGATFRLVLAESPEE
jgi:signal transduction histidine kinase